MRHQVLKLTGANPGEFVISRRGLSEHDQSINYADNRVTTRGADEVAGITVIFRASLGEPLARPPSDRLPHDLGPVDLIGQPARTIQPEAPLRTVHGHKAANNRATIRADQWGRTTLRHPFRRQCADRGQARQVCGGAGQRNVLATHYARAGEQPVAYIDETYHIEPDGRPRFYVMAAVVVLEKDRDPSRTEIDTLVPEGWWHTTESTTKYASLARRHWQTWLPTQYSAIEVPVSFSSQLGTEVSDRIASLEPDLLEPSDPDKDHLVQVGRSRMARLQAEELVMHEMMLLPPENLNDSDMDRTRTRTRCRPSG